jgi:MFS family permease
MGLAPDSTCERRTFSSNQRVGCPVARTLASPSKALDATGPGARATNEFRHASAWRVVAAALIGAALGLTALPFYSLGVFAKPLAAEFGWSRATIQGGITFTLLGVVCSAWLTGWLIDRIGVRRVALASQLGLAAGFVALSLQNGDATLWRATWFATAVVGVGTTPLTWTRGIAAWFVARCGLAIGIALSGTGLTAFVAPPLLTMLVAAYGWRAGYLAIALSIVAVGMPLVWFFFRERGTADDPVAQVADGLTFRQALRHRRFWLLIAGFVAVSSAVGGIIPNLIPMLTDSGLSAMQAASFASLLGLSVMAGRLVAGWLLDRYWAPLVAAMLLIPPAVACLLLAGHVWPGLAVMLVGLAGGAEFDLLAYLCLRYFGMRHFGQIYAWQWASFSLAAGLGPLALAALFDGMGNYRAGLVLGAVLFVVGPLALLMLGPYPRFGAESGSSRSPRPA